MKDGTSRYVKSISVSLQPVPPRDIVLLPSGLIVRTRLSEYMLI